jgi:hypothetical protein
MVSFEALSYRDNQGGLRLRRDELVAERARELTAVPSDLRRVYARRASRIAGGVVAIAGAAFMLVAAALSGGAEVLLGSPIVKLSLTTILLGGVFLAIPAMVVARIVARIHFRGGLRTALAITDDPTYDIARLEAGGPLRLACHRADRLERASVALPLVGWSLCAPLVSHFAVYVALSNTQGEWFERAAREFDSWILISIVVTAAAHAVLVICAVRFAKNLRRANDSAAQPMPSAWAPLGWTALAGCLPGVVLYVVPPVLVVLTGLAFIPAVFAFVRARVLSERNAIALALALEQREQAQLAFA